MTLWGSLKKQSEIVGLQENIDCYDLIKSGFANDLDDTSQIYWILSNAGGMDDQDLTAFVNRLKRTRAAIVQDGVTVEGHTTDVPYAAREALLTRLRADLFEQAMAYDPQKLASGGSVVTAAIKAAFVPLDQKTNEYEFCVQDFLDSLLKVVGIGDEHPTFTRSVIINQQEQIQTVLSTSEYLPHDYITEKVLTILGDGDQTENILDQMEKEEAERYEMADNISKGKGAVTNDGKTPGMIQDESAAGEGQSAEGRQTAQPEES